MEGHTGRMATHEAQVDGVGRLHPTHIAQSAAEQQWDVKGWDTVYCTNKLTREYCIEKGVLYRWKCYRERVLRDEATRLTTQGP